MKKIFFYSILFLILASNFIFSSDKKITSPIIVPVLFTTPAQNANPNSIDQRAANTVADNPDTSTSQVKSPPPPLRLAASPARSSSSGVPSLSRPHSYSSSVVVTSPHSQPPANSVLAFMSQTSSTGATPHILRQTPLHSIPESTPRRRCVALLSSMSSYLELATSDSQELSKQLKPFYPLSPKSSTRNCFDQQIARDLKQTLIQAAELIKVLNEPPPVKDKIIAAGAACQTISDPTSKK